MVHDSTEGMSLIPTHLITLYNVQQSIPTILFNAYFYVDGDTLYSEEGTTQGDPLALAFYALATVSLIQKLTEPATQVHMQYAHDATICGKISALHTGWDQVPHWVLA